MPNHLNLNLLRSLYVLLDECHVSNAAKRLSITQSGMSRQLSQLRDMCDDPLLVRSGNQLVATERALLLKEKVHRLLEECDELLSDQPFEPASWEQEIVLSSSDYFAQYIVPKIANRFSVSAPKLNISYRLWQPHFLEDFDSHGIHLASTMLDKPPKDLSYMKLGQDHSVCVMRKDHPLSLKSSFDCKAMTSFPHLKVTGGGDKDSLVDKGLGQLGYKRRVALMLPFFSAAVDALQGSDYLMIAPQHIAQNLCSKSDLVFCPLPFVTGEHHYWLVWHPKYDRNRDHQWVREQVKLVLEASPYSVGVKPRQD
ncbi:LysR family transcriptional regulator [Vibrio caribbeanicus]|uniref:LysR family transcriptional regulator n=1 Tax=Vibrio caribbeanicus TaxID=701175 RepID=UPI0022849293|nr:LysR family transcriptional regulator [Vibrio caribbeanicus]MCY9845148.1 LysR family transcriptional regulator [Vibrio caribbeanicus]